MSIAVAPRQTNWKLILTTAAVVVVFGLLFLKGFWFPYQDNRRKLLGAEEEYDSQRRELLAFLKDKKRLERDRLIGLPRNLNQAEREYIDYLQSLLSKCGFDAHPDVQQTGADFRTLSSAPGKKAGHIAVTYLVRTHGSWTSIVKFLESFQRTPFLHRLKTWTVDATASTKGSPKLTLNVIIEALMVNRNEQRPDNLWGVDPRLIAVDALLALNHIPAGWATLLRPQALLLPEMPARDYAEVPRLNPFVGGIPISDVDLEAKEKKKEKQKREAQGKARLVMTMESHDRAILVVPAETDKTTEITLKCDGTFPLWDGKSAKILRICHREVYFQFDSKIYVIKIGEQVREALERPLSVSEGKSLGLPGT
jgi:hypothetical protein